MKDALTIDAFSTHFPALLDTAGEPEAFAKIRTILEAGFRQRGTNCQAQTFRTNLDFWNGAIVPRLENRF